MFGIPWRLIAYGVSALTIIGALWGYGHHKYEAGVTAERARWTPQLIAAQKALAEANARARALESAAQAITNEAENRHAQTIADLNQRAADADTRVRGLVRQLAAAHPGCRELPEAGNASIIPDAAGAGDERADRFGSAATELARRCESDARTLTDLQSWIRSQMALEAPLPAHR